MSGGSPADAAAQEAVVELLSWVDLSNRVTAGTELALLRSTVEPQCRTEIVMEMLSERSQLAAMLVRMALKVCEDAAAEYAATKASTQKLRDEMSDLPRRMEAQEKSMLSEIHSRYEAKLAAFEDGGSRLQEARAKLQAEVVDLTRRRDEELSALAAFRSEADDRKARLQEGKAAAAAEMQQLEVHLEALRSKVAAEKALLQHLEEEEAVKRRKIDVLADMGVNVASRGSPPTGPDANAASRSSVASSSKLDYGISTLQTVREHLRDIRESSLSPNRVAPTQRVVSSSPEVSAATTAAYSGVSASPINPWKERLRQLQGDLQSLRADLGAK